jgi:hypothetical protein
VCRHTHVVVRAELAVGDVAGVSLVLVRLAGPTQGLIGTRRLRTRQRLVPASAQTHAAVRGASNALTVRRTLKLLLLRAARAEVVHRAQHTLVTDAEEARMAHTIAPFLRGRGRTEIRDIHKTGAAGLAEAALQRVVNL